VGAFGVRARFTESTRIEAPHSHAFFVKERVVAQVDP
jgi:hypothetical protein